MQHGWSAQLARAAKDNELAPVCRGGHVEGLVPALAGRALDRPLRALLSQECTAVGTRCAGERAANTAQQCMISIRLAAYTRAWIHRQLDPQDMPTTSRSGLHSWDCGTPLLTLAQLHALCKATPHVSAHRSGRATNRFSGAAYPILCASGPRARLAKEQDTVAIHDGVADHVVHPLGQHRQRRAHRQRQAPEAGVHQEVLHQLRVRRRPASRQ